MNYIFYIFFKVGFPVLLFYNIYILNILQYCAYFASSTSLHDKREATKVKIKMLSNTKRLQWHLDSMFQCKLHNDNKSVIFICWQAVSNWHHNAQTQFCMLANALKATPMCDTNNTTQTFGESINEHYTDKRCQIEKLYF